MAAQRTEEQISDIMRRVKSRDTAPEAIFRKALWARGVRFRICRDELPGKPDVALSAARLAIFIDGDFWHGHQWVRRGLDSLEAQFAASKNAGYWVRKIRRNAQRDVKHTLALLDRGWRVLRFWESDLSERLEECVDTVMDALRDESAGDGAGSFPQPAVAEFFAGIGLMRLGLEQSGWRTVFANDNDPKKRQMYEQNFGEDELCGADIQDLRGDDIPDCTLATASFPCNDLSLAGKYAGLNGSRSGTFWAFARLLEEMGPRRPRLVMLENVPGFLNSHGGEDLAAALKRINSLGYACDVFLLDAAAFVPQSRRRLFIVGSRREGDRATVWDIAKLPESPLRPAKLRQFMRARADEIDWHLRPLPAPPERSQTLDDLLEDVPHDSPIWWNRRRAEKLYSQFTGAHAELAASMVQASDYRHGAVFRRVRQGRTRAEMRTDGLAGCLRTPRGGSARQILFKAGRGEYHARLLTPRECARLQGVGDDFRIEAPDNQALFGFGDAVCVKAIDWIATRYLWPLIHEMMRGVPLAPGPAGRR